MYVAECMGSVFLDVSRIWHGIFLIFSDFASWDTDRIGYLGLSVGQELGGRSTWVLKA